MQPYLVLQFESRSKILKKSIPILAVKNSDDIAIESLRSIRTAIHFALANAKNNIIMITGPSPAVGKSLFRSTLQLFLLKVTSVYYSLMQTCVVAICINILMLMWKPGLSNF